MHRLFFFDAVDFEFNDLFHAFLDAYRSSVTISLFSSSAFLSFRPHGEIFLFD
jgi:hypothetical protein